MSSVEKSYISYKCRDLTIYKWKNSHTYYFKILDEYVVCLSQVLFIKKVSK